MCVNLAVAVSAVVIFYCTRMSAGPVQNAKSIPVFAYNSIREGVPARWRLWATIAMGGQRGEIMQTKFTDWTGQRRRQRVKSEWLLLINRAVNSGILLWTLWGIITGDGSSWVVWTAFKLLTFTFMVSVLALVVSMLIERRRSQ